MNKKTITLVTMALLSVMGVKADVIPSSYYSEVGAGAFYLYNVTQEQFLTGTPSMSSTPVALTLAVVDETKYSISPATNQYLKAGFYNGQYLWNNGWADNGFFKWSFATDGEKTYNLSITATADADSYFKNGTTYYLNTVNSAYSTTATEANEWALITEDNYTAYLASLDPVIIHKNVITEAKGDATSLITDPKFDIAAGNDNGWTGGTATNCNTWLKGDRDYESSADNITFSQTLSNMPKGTYKLVAAVRGDNGTTATANLNGTSGTTITNHAFDTTYPQINTNGVQMPFSNMGGFNYSSNALGWQWATVTYELVNDGDLTINFVMTGARWKGIDDIHLYYMSDGTNTYAVEYTDGINNNDHIVTCDLSTDNPNKIFTATSNIYTASGAIANNLRVSNGFINNLVLYDGYEVSIPASTRAVASTLYRNISAGAFATICCPFQITGGAGVDGTFYQPESLTSGTLNFKTVTTKDGGKAYLYKATSAVTTFTGPKDGWLATTPVDNGAGVTMKGTFSEITAVPTNVYVLSGTNLYKVNSVVSLNPFRAYFTIPGESPARISLSFDGEASSINAVNGSEDMINGYYDLHGRRVTQPTKGLYIVNGKKLVVK